LSTGTARDSRRATDAAREVTTYPTFEQMTTSDGPDPNASPSSVSQGPWEYMSEVSK